jgi:hypothetical protein
MHSRARLMIDKTTDSFLYISEKESPFSFMK